MGYSTDQYIAYGIELGDVGESGYGRGAIWGTDAFSEKKYEVENSWAGEEQFEQLQATIKHEYPALAVSNGGDSTFEQLVFIVAPSTLSGDLLKAATGGVQEPTADEASQLEAFAARYGTAVPAWIQWEERL